MLLRDERACEEKRCFLKTSLNRLETERSDFLYKLTDSSELLAVSQTMPFLKSFIFIFYMNYILLRGEIGGRKCWDPHLVDTEGIVERERFLKSRGLSGRMRHPRHRRYRLLASAVLGANRGITSVA